MPSLSPYLTIQSKDLSLIIDCKTGIPSIHYLGLKLNQSCTNDMLSELSTRQEAKCAVQEEVPLALTPCLGHGFTGHPGINLADAGIAWSVGPMLTEIKQVSNTEAVLISHDDTRNIELQHWFKFAYDSNVLQCTSKVINRSEMPFAVNDLAAPTFTIPDHISKLLVFEGRWSQEFQTRTIDLFLGAYARENRKGKTSHDNFPGLLIHEQHANERKGECYGFHLGWSGNHRTRVELLPEQRTYVQMGELLGANEIVLQQDQDYTSPTLFVTYTNSGLSKLSQQFHDFMRQHLLNPRFHDKARPIHYNTWEGIYFNHDIQTLKELADIAAETGAERFVLDDGWFKGRRHDKAGLGDWIVDKHIYPDGLSPIIEHVIGKGMAFGIWFEPEMVNPDSDLYRAHPDWVLSTQGNPQLSFRHQLVLDLTRNEVCDYLFSQIDTILSEYPHISYIKWDMNRDINHSGNQYGTSAVHAQTNAVYSLIDRVKHAHPNVEIESCSSGGARIDFGVLSHTDRFWTSDSNDALDRLNIQRGCSFFFPAGIMGSHVGPRDCHITGRHIPISTRIGVAMFGHMGMEMDPRELTEEESSLLKKGFELHKAHRELIHKGDLFRLDSNGDSIDFGVVAKDKSEALFAYNSVHETKRTQPRKYRFVGLDPNALYKVNVVWPLKLYEYSPSILQVIENKVYSAQVLSQIGMQLPIVFPQTTMIFKLSRHD